MTFPNRPSVRSGRSNAVPLPADEALRRLREGNRRFAQNAPSSDTMVSKAARSALVAIQSPIAAVLSCSDARVPAEIVFDQGLGDLFVVRVAGNAEYSLETSDVEFFEVSE